MAKINYLRMIKQRNSSNGDSESVKGKILEEVKIVEASDEKTLVQSAKNLFLEAKLEKSQDQHSFLVNMLEGIIED